MAQEKCPEMLSQENAVYTGFNEIIGLFGKCHNACNGGVTLDSDINQLGKSNVVLKKTHMCTHNYSNV